MSIKSFLSAPKLCFILGTYLMQILSSKPLLFLKHSTEIECQKLLYENSALCKDSISKIVFVNTLSHHFK